METTGAATAGRRARQPSAKAAAAQDAAPASSAASGGPGGAARRSQRHVKPPEAQDIDHEASKPAKRRSRPPSPVRSAPASPPPRPSSAAASAENSPALAATPGRRRRPTARATAVDVNPTITSSYAPHKALGRHSARECTLLCEVILDDVRRSALAADALEKDRPPAAIRWEKVAKRMLKAHKVALTARECQNLWKFLAYAQAPESAAEDELLPTSDEEDMERPVREINAQVGKARPAQNKRVRSLAFTADATATTGEDNAKVASANEANAAVKQVEGEEKPHEQSSTGGASSMGPPTTPKSPTQLHPGYELPPGAISGWQRPFNFKQMLPLTFVAEKFLKKRAVTPQPASQLVVPPPIAALTTPAKTTPVGANSANATAPPTAKITSATTQNAVKLESNALKKRKPNDASADKAKKKPRAVSTLDQPRQPFIPSSTPPPVPNPARTELDFYRLAYARLADPASAEKMSMEDLRRVFNAAAPSMQAECKKLALIDLDRFNRECVRRRIWEKAMGAGSNSNSPLPSPAPGQSTPTTASTVAATTGVVVTTVPSATEPKGSRT